MRQHRRYQALLLFLCGLVLGTSSADDSRTTLYIQGFVPANNLAFNSEAIIPAATIAIDEINNNTELLADYRLHLEWRNTLCDPSEATWQLIQSVLDFPGSSTNTTTKIAFLGGGCSLSTEPTAALSGRFYNITQISYGASTPGLSDRTMFPKFFRTIPSETQSNSARFALMNMYGWSRVATLHETQNVFSLTVEDFHMTYDNIFGNGNLTAEEEAEEEDENLILRSFTDDPEIPLRQIKEKDIRIILGYMYMDKAVTTLCQAYHMNLTTDNHLWMLPAWYDEGWWNTTVGGDEDPPNKRCSPDQMRDAIRYSFFLDSYNYDNDTNATTDFSGLSRATFTAKYNEELERFNANDPLAAVGGSVPHSYITFTYDAVYTIALALNRTAIDLKPLNLTLGDFTYSDSNITEKIVQNMKLTDFNGISGRVTFDENGTRMGLNGIYQLRDDTEDGSLQLKLIAIHDPGPEGMNYNFEFDIQPQWKGDEPPRDRRTPVNIYLNEGLVITGAVFVTLAIIVAIGLLVFNLVTIRMPLIADSAPLINTIIIVGCILMLGACYLLGIDSANPDADDDIFLTTEEVNQSTIDARDERYASVCTARLWLLTLGFTLSFGALFGKTWQVYRIYTNPKLKKEPFKMWNFLIMLSIFLAIDLLYLTIWSAAAPFERDTETQETSNDRIEMFEKCTCNGFSYLIGILYVYKGLQVIFGLFLAYESRNVKYFYINDSRFVSIAMYIVVILVGIGAPLSLVLAVNFIIDPAYALAVFMIIATCMSCLLILFIPKFIYMAKGKDTMIRENSREEVTVSDGLQLGKSTVDQTDVQHAETQVNDLKQQVAERSVELQELKGQEGGEGEEPPKNRMGSDGDSGILMTGDTNEHETTSSESEQQRENNNTPPSLASAEVTGTVTDGTDL